MTNKLTCSGLQVTNLLVFGNSIASASVCRLLGSSAIVFRFVVGHIQIRWVGNIGGMNVENW